jgi:hypothetical protein
MRKRIALFVVGFVVALGIFLLYQALTGAGFLNPHKPVAIADQDLKHENHPPTYEQRAPNGDLLYLLSAQKAEPMKDEGGTVLPGQYALTQPRATYYTTDGNLLYIRADNGTVTINDRGMTGGPGGGGAGTSGGSGSSSGINDHFRGAHLSGHVVLTYGPRDSFTDTSMDIKTGQFQVQFEKDLDLNYAESLVTSPGLVHLRADQDRMRFDGENLTIAFSRTAKKQQIELLRVEPTSGKDNYMLIRNVGKNGLSLDGAGRGAPTTPAETSSPATVAPASPPPAAPTAPAVVQAPATSAETPPTTYKISFGKNVTATLGKGNLTCAQLYVFFQAAGQQAGKSAPAQKASEAPAPDTATTTAPAVTPPPLSGVSPPTPPPATADDLAITWTGPMEMRPSAPDDIQLTDRRDQAIEAVGTPERPVLIHNELQTARAGILKYRKLPQKVELEPGEVGPVVVNQADPAAPNSIAQQLTCQGIHYASDEHQMHLDGPGHLEVAQSFLRKDVHASGNPLTVVWEKALDLEFFKAPANGAKESLNVRRAIFSGRSVINNVDFHLDSDTLDLLLARAGKGDGSKSTPSLEHMLAMGNVHVKGESKAGTGILDAANPDGIDADRLELLTTPGTDGKPTPSRLMADGNVTAWGYQTEDGGKGHVSKNTLYTPKFVAELGLKTGAKKTASTGLGGIEPTAFIASNGVIVQIDSATNPTIFAKGKTLTAHIDRANNEAKAVLDGEQLPNGTQAFAELSQGERGDNKITGLRIFLDQKNQSIDIPGKGTFNFVQPPQKQGQAAMPAEVTWTDSMHYDNRSLLAHFTGNIDAHLVGSTDQIGKLTCDKTFDVQLMKDPKGATPPPSPAGPVAMGKLHLGELTAIGDVTAEGAKFDPAGKLLTRIYLTKTETLLYNEASKNLDIPGPGQLLLQDYRADKNTKSTGDSHGDTLFTWDGSLTYNGPTGLIAFSKNVYMNHHPLKPFKLAEDEPSTKTTTPVTAPPPPPPDQHLILTADSLIAKVSTAKGPDAGPTSASPIALSAGSQQTLESILARGRAILSLGDEKLSAETLTFDKPTNIATATASDVDHPAEIFRPGEGITTAESIKWDITKGKNAIEVVGGHGTMQQN